MSRTREKKSQDGTMSLSGHLKELRNRLIVCVVCLVVVFLIGLNHAPQLVEFLTNMGKDFGYNYIFISPQELLLQYFSVSFIFAVIVTLPVILYNVWAFIQPGLKKNENMMFLFALIFGLICFIIGVFFA